MKKLLYIVVFSLSISTFGQCVEMQIETGKFFLVNKNLRITESLKDKDNYNDWIKPEKILFGRIHVENCFQDTLFFNLRDKMPILITGLKNLDTSIIRIANIPLTKYSHIDTSYFETTKYLKNGKVDTNSITTKIKNPYNSIKFQYTEQEISINGKIYKSKLVSIPREYRSWNCTPGEISHYQYFKGIEKIYLFEIKNQ
jgi:hypothetical protein